MEVILMTDETTIKATTFIDENVDVNLIRSTIEAAQDLYILPILGTALYNEVLSQISAETLTVANTNLLNNYIRKALVWWTLSEGVDVFTYKIRNKGVLKETSENTQTVSLEEIKRLIDKFRNRAEEYSERTTKFLFENQSTYPLINNAGSGIDTIHPNDTNYQSGWYLGKKRNCNPFDYNQNNQIDL